MQIRIGRVVAGAVALTSTAVMTTTVNASAAPGDEAWSPKGEVVYDHVWERKGVVVSVEEHGDFIRLADTKANGHAAYLTVQAGSKGYTLHTGNGNNPVVGMAAWGGKYNLPEGATVHLTFWGDGNRPHSPNRYFVNDH